MARFEVGDKVIITEGDFKGQRGAIVSKELVGDEIVVALEDGGREIDTHEAHVNRVEKD